MSKIKIRKYIESDIVLVDNLVKNILFEIFNSRPERIEELENIKLFLVVEDGGRVVGTIALIEKSSDFVVKRLYVDKNYRNKGLAQKLYNKVEDFARKNKIKRLKLSTTPEMKSAIAFYNKNGFNEISRNEDKNQIFFEKELKWIL